jgi:lipopolysaccharide heptosyltransferase II
VRILIVLPGAIGDIVRALPLLGRIRRGLPDAHLGWVVEPPSAPVLAGHRWLDEVLVFERRAAWSAIPPLVRRLRAGRWDVALDLGRGIKSALLARASGAPSRLGFARVDAREAGWLLTTRRLPAQGVERSKLEQFLAFGDLLGLRPGPVAFGIEPTAAEAEQAEVLLGGLRRPVVAACVGSSCPARRWFPDRTAAVVNALDEAPGGSAILLGTAADAGFGAAVARATRRPVRDLIGRTSLRQLIAVLARCGLAFGPDSGALHLAAAMGTPVVSLWGATSADRSAPFGSERLVVRGEAPCAPCFLRDCPIGRVCMQTIAPATVLEKARQGLAA